MKNTITIIFCMLIINNVFAQANTNNALRPYTFDDVLKNGPVKTPPPDPPPSPLPPKKQLGVIDRWRYESCQQDASTAPTSQGVSIKMRICREKFDQ